MSRRVTGGLLAVVGGLLLAGAAVGRWTVQVLTNDVGGVPIEEVSGIAGAELAPAALPLGVVGVLLGLGLLALPGRGAAMLGVAAAAVGGAAQVLVVLGIVRALGEPGALTLAPFLSCAGALAVTAAGFVGLRPAKAARLPARYELDDEDPEEAEWHLASADPPDDQPGPSA